jgi:hypothetical protein
MAVKNPPDLLLHSSGVMRDGNAYVFSGVSGAGKSTACRLLSREPSFTVLHDDAIAVTQAEDGFQAWSTPLSGEMPARHSRGAPLKAVFFLKHGQTNYATRLNGKKAAMMLALNVMPPITVSNGVLVLEPEESLKLLLTLAESVPCYELYFRPEHGFWKQIPQLSDNELPVTLKKG